MAKGCPELEGIALFTSRKEMERKDNKEEVGRWRRECSYHDCSHNCRWVIGWVILATT